MKKIRLILFTIILMTMAAKVSVTPLEIEYPALSVDENVEKVDQFFEYKVHHIQDNSYLYKCNTSINCCRV